MATANSTRVPGSGTVATIASGEASPLVVSSDAPVTEGSKMNVVPAPTVKFVPAGRALEFVRYSVPSFNRRPAAVIAAAAEDKRPAAGLAQTAIAGKHSVKRERAAGLNAAPIGSDRNGQGRRSAVHGIAVE